MNFSHIEECFNKAFFHSFSKKKLLVVFPVLLLCALLVIFCQALSIGSSNWISMSMIFLPIFLTSGLFLSIGVLIIQIYYHERKNLAWNFGIIFSKSWRLVIGTFYLSVPIILLYVCLWVLLGLFILMQEIPYVGPVFNIILSFAPFITILSSILLVIFNLGLLFFVTPSITLRYKEDLSFIRDYKALIKDKLFSLIVMFCIGISPLILVLAILSVAFVATNLNYLIAEQGITQTLQWFFISIPFVIFVTPALIFFFNFSAETYNLLFYKRRG